MGWTLSFNSVLNEKRGSHICYQLGLELFTSLENHWRLHSATVSVRHRPLYWELQEHYCLSPNEPLSPGVGDDSVEDVLDARIPRGTRTTFRQREGGNGNFARVDIALK